MEVTVVIGLIVLALCCIVICVEACLFLYFAVIQWVWRLVPIWTAVASCGWTVTFWTCLKGAFWVALETLVAVLITLLCLIIALINLAVLIKAAIL